MLLRASRDAGVIVGGLALWLLFHPYTGIWHDARLYTVAALRWLNPEAYARDVWFAFGSQDDWTLFSPLYAAFIEGLGIAAGARALVLLGALAWVTSAWTICRALLPRRPAVAATLAMCLLLLWYSLSGTDVFQVSESFVSARIVAVPLSLAGLAAMLRGQRVAAVVLLLLAAAMHPVMACAPIAVAVCLCCGERLQLGLLGAALSVLVVAMANPLGWAAFDPIDGMWMRLIRESGASALLHYRDFRLARLLGSLALLLWASALAPLPQARLYRTVALVASWSVLAAQLICFFQPTALLVQMQFWRAAWLAVVLAIPAAFAIIAAAWQRGGSARWAPAAGGLALVSGGLWGSALVLLAWLLYVVMPRASVPRLLPADSRSRRLLGVGAGALILLMLPTLYFDLVGIGINVRGSALDANWQYLLRALGFYLLLPAALWWLLSREDARFLLAGTILATALAAGAYAFWDLRPASKRAQEAGFARAGTQPLFSDKVKPGETVYWAGNTLRVWFELGTASYAGEEQSVGIVFSQPRTMELWRRMQRLQRRFDGLAVSSRSKGLNLHRHDSVTPLALADLRYLCADPALDHVVDAERLDGYFVGQHSERTSGRENIFYLYDCRRIRMSSEK